MISFRQKGDFSKTTRYLQKAKDAAILQVLEKYGSEGVAALASATPIDSGETANSWYYEVGKSNGSYTLAFCNSHINKGVHIAIVIQYGHGTGTGGWVEGRDYIYLAIQFIFVSIANEAWREVTEL